MVNMKIAEILAKLDRLLTMLRMSKFTGRLVIRLTCNQGGVRRFEISEDKPLTDI